MKTLIIKIKSIQELQFKLALLFAGLLFTFLSVGLIFSNKLFMI